MKTIEHVHAEEVSEETRLRELIQSLSDYIEQYHGGWVCMQDFDGEILTIEMGGACEAYSLSSANLHGWIGGTVRQFLPHIVEIRAI